MEWYILKSVAILAALMLFYKLLLEKENMHNFKRFYLLFAVLASVGIPFITITTYVEPTTGNFDPVLFHYSEEVSVAESRSFADYLPYVLWSIYALGVIFFGLKFIRNLRELLLKIRINPKVKMGRFTRILLREKVDPHTFFSYIFLNRRKYEQEQIPREVIIHEEAHARQKHSLDILFVELLQIVFWMNPLIILLKDAVKLNHEFLADRAVIEKGIQTSGYQNTLLSFSSGHLHSDLVNPINYSSIKKRFTVMKTQTSKKAILGRGLLILPLISLLFFSFSNKEIVEKEINVVSADTMNTTTLMLEVDNSGKVYFQKNETNLEELRKHINEASYTSYHIEVAENAPSSILIDLRQLMAQNRLPGSVALCTTTETTQDKATPEMIAEYNRLVKYYNAMQNANPEGELQVKQEDINKIMAILGKMTPEQKKEAEQIKFDVPPPPPPAPAASAIEEYNRLVRKYNAIPKDELQIKQEDINKIMSIRGRMTPEQKEKAEQIKFDVPPPPPPAPAPAPQSPPASEKKNVEVPPAPPTQKTEKKLTLMISPKSVVVNGISANLRGIAKLVDEATSDWSRADFNLHGLEIQATEDVSKDFIDRLNVELEKTKLVRFLDRESDFIPYFTNSVSPPAAPEIEKYLTRDSTIYLDGKIISAEKAMELLKTKRDKIKISIHQNGEENTVITMESI